MRGQMTCWDEVWFTMGGALPKDTVIHLWRSTQTQAFVALVTDAGAPANRRWEVGGRWEGKERDVDGSAMTAGWSAAMQEQRLGCRGFSCAG